MTTVQLDRIRLSCACGVRLGEAEKRPTLASGLAAIWDGDAALLKFAWQPALTPAARRNAEQEAGEPGRVRRFEDWDSSKHFTKLDWRAGESVNYSCRTCRRNWRVTVAALRARLDRAAAAGRTRLEFGVDL